MVLIALGGAPLAAQRAASFRLDNGLEVAVVEDRRAPIVTHFIGYRAGAADDPEGLSGVAHVVEHLMFSAAPAAHGPPFAAEISRLGGRSNAVTAHDATLYHARVPKEWLRLVMAREAARMTGLAITEAGVASERQVILAERRSRIDSRPFAALIERADALLGAPHYARPSIGAAEDIGAIGVPDAAAFHRRHYVPGNAFVVVVGDVSADAVRALADDTFGRLPVVDGARPLVGWTPPTESGTLPGRRHRFATSDPRARSTTVYRAYRVPGYPTARAGEAEAMELLSAILTSGGTSRLAARWQGTGPAAADVDGGYLGVRRHGGQLAIHVVAAKGADSAAIEAGIDEVIGELAERPPGVEEIDEARRTLLVQQAFRADDQFLLAQLYAEGLGAGLSVGHIEGLEQRLGRVGPEELRQAALFLRDTAPTVTAVLSPANDSRPESTP